MPMPMTTISGLNAWDLISAFQKSVRRGLEQEAMEIAAELEPTHLPHLLNRLQVISHEDIGLANPGVIPLVATSVEQVKKWRKSDNGAWRLALANIILALCRSPKSREADHFQCVIYGRRAEGKRLDIPDWAFDKHTRRGRKMGRGIDHFREQAAQLNPAPEKDEYEDEAYTYWKRAEAGELDLYGHTSGRQQTISGLAGKKV